jgi:hypothetical protein
MSDKFKAEEWDAREFRIYAGNRASEVAQALTQTDEQLRTVVEDIFASERAVDEICSAWRGGQGALYEMMGRLTSDRQFYGRMKSGAAPQLERAVKLLDRQLDLLASKNEFERFARTAEAVERLTKRERDVEKKRLLQEREYCDANLKTREDRHKATRGGPPGGPSGGGGDSVGAAKTPPDLLERSQSHAREGEKSMRPPKPNRLRDILNGLQAKHLQPALQQHERPRGGGKDASGDRDRTTANPRNIMNLKDIERER